MLTPLQEKCNEYRHALFQLKKKKQLCKHCILKIYLYSLISYILFFDQLYIYILTLKLA